MKLGIENDKYINEISGYVERKYWKNHQKLLAI